MLQLKYPYPYQKFINQPLSYTKRNNLLSRAYQLNSWNNIPVNADIPSVAPVARLWQSVKSLITPLQRTATSRSNVDEDQSAVERRIQEYYDQRLNKKRNKWMFKPINGTTPHLKHIFIGRCWDFVTTKRKNLQDPDKLDCQEMWKVFSKSFAFKGPCDVTYDDYTPFFNLYKEKPLNNRVCVVLLYNSTWLCQACTRLSVSADERRKRASSKNEWAKNGRDERDGGNPVSISTNTSARLLPRSLREKLFLVSKWQMLKYQNVSCKRPGLTRSLSFFFVQRRNGNENIAYNKKWIFVLSVFIAIIPGVEFQGTISKSRNVKKKNFVVACWHSHKTRKRQRNAQKCVMHVQRCCLLIKPIAFLVLFFFLLRSRCCRCVES